MSTKRKWLKVLLLSMMGLSSFGGAQMDLKQIEDLLHIMNESKVEFTIPDEGDSGDDSPRCSSSVSISRSELPHRAAKAMSERDVPEGV